MAIAFVKNVASQSNSNTTTTTLTIPAAGCAAGNFLVVRSARGSAAISTIVDSKSNTYDVLASRTSTNRVYLHGCKITNALVSGDTITITWASMGDNGAICDEFSGVANTTVDGTAGAANATSNSPSASTTPSNATDLVIGYVYIDNNGGNSFTEDADADGGDTWHSLTLGNGNGSNDDIRGAYKITTSATTFTYNPSLGASLVWNDLVAAVQATADSGAVAITGKGANSNTGRAGIQAALAVTGKGTAATTGRAASQTLLATSGHGDNATAGSGSLNVSAVIAGRGAVATAGNAQLSIPLSSAKGTNANTGRAALNATLVVAGSGANSTTGRSAAVLTLGLSGRGAVCTAGTATLTVTSAAGNTITITGHGDIATTGTAHLVSDPEPDECALLTETGFALLTEDSQQLLDETCGEVTTTPAVGGPLPRRHRVFRKRIHIRFTVLVRYTPQPVYWTGTLTVVVGSVTIIEPRHQQIGRRLETRARARDGCRRTKISQGPIEARTAEPRSYRRELLTVGAELLL